MGFMRFCLRFKKIVLMAMLFCTQACSFGLVSAERREDPTTSPAAPTLEQLRRAMVLGIYEGTAVQFSDGAYEGEAFVAGGAARPRVVLLARLTATGNLDNLPGDERVVLLSESSGGSGEYIHLAVFGLQGGKVENLGTARVGDRVRLRRLNIDGRTIVLDVVEAGPGEPMCCPTYMARKIYRLEPGGLKQITDEATGRLSLAAIADIEWTLEEMNGQTLAPDSKAPDFRVTGGTVGGFGGCNCYTATVKESVPGQIALGNLASTKMACADVQMSLEDAFLRDLGRVTSYMFVEGRLALGWVDGNRNGLLVFRQ